MYQYCANRLKNISSEKLRENKLPIAKAALISLVGYVGLKYVLQWQRLQSSDNRWEKVRIRKRILLLSQAADFDIKYIKTFKLSEELKRRIIQSDIKSLKNLFYTQKVTVVEVLLTFIERTIKYGFKNNIISDVIFEEALQQAKLQDDQIKIDKEIINKEGNYLFGVPVTVKDQFIINGQDSCFGTAARLFKPYNYDGNQVHMIKQAGGIIFAKTTMPQLGVAVETNNIITGRSNCTYNSLRTSGGSSGGQAVAISSRCCIVGLGTDLGGSIRIPSNNNGICGYKPSMKRVCLGGSAILPVSWLGQRNMIGTGGPMAQTVDDLVSMLKTLWNQDVYAQAPIRSKQLSFKPYKWDDQVYQGRNKIRIGYIKEFELLPTCATTHRAIDMAKQALEAQGHTLIPFTIPVELLEQLFTLCSIFVFGEGEFKTQHIALEGEKLIPELQVIGSMYQSCKMLLKIQSAYHRLTGQRRQELQKNSAIKDYNAFDFLCASGLQNVLQSTMAQEWSKLNIEALIQPVSASAPLLHGQSDVSYFSLIYTLIWNFFDYNAGSVPITVVEAHEQHYDTVDTYSSPDANTQVMKNAMKDSLGLPVGIQIVTQPFNDELCLSLMKQIEEKIKFNHRPNIIC